MSDHITAEELHSQFKSETKTVIVKSWATAQHPDGAPVEIRKLTVGEADRVQEITIGDNLGKADEKGNIPVDIAAVNAATLQRVSFGLAIPRLKVAELNEMEGDAKAGIIEIDAALREWDQPKKSKEAESSSTESPKPSAKQSGKSKAK